MERIIIIASHHKLSLGMKDTIKYITNTNLRIIALAAYMDNTPIDKQIKEIMNDLSEEDEVFIFTDILAGSVNQKFEKYIQRPHTNLITGMNLSIIMAIVLDFSNKYISTEKIENMINSARKELIYVNNAKVQLDEDDE
ncbi:MAG: PTS N-acetylglucosamine transporter subunit IIBC [Lactobacillus sp.]|nr:PTS N-acetylglucosamine transporter subunit IIBC [Lactobacillus sp.]